MIQQKLWDQLPADKQKEMIKQEENAVFNQVVLFVSRVIWLRCPLEFSESIIMQYVLCGDIFEGTQFLGLKTCRHFVRQFQAVGQKISYAM